MRVEYDDNVIEDDLLIGMVTNTASAGGLLKVKNFMLDDGVFEVMLVKKPKNPAEIGGIVRALFTNDMTNKNIIFFRTSRLKVTNLSGAPVPWTRDGEYGGSAEVNEICCYKRAVEFVLCGKEDLPFEKS
jgi:diacylglycerol kinase family enzyme